MRTVDGIQAIQEFPLPKYRPVSTTTQLFRSNLINERLVIYNLRPITTLEECVASSCNLVSTRGELIVEFSIQMKLYADEMTRKNLGVRSNTRRIRARLNYYRTLSKDSTPRRKCGRKWVRERP